MRDHDDDDDDADEAVNETIDDGESLLNEEGVEANPQMVGHADYDHCDPVTDHCVCACENILLNEE